MNLFPTAEQFVCFLYPLIVDPYTGSQTDGIKPPHKTDGTFTLGISKKAIWCAIGTWNANWLPILLRVSIFEIPSMNSASSSWNHRAVAPRCPAFFASSRSRSSSSASLSAERPQAWTAIPNMTTLAKVRRLISIKNVLSFTKNVLFCTKVCYFLLKHVVFSGFNCQFTRG